MTWLLAPSQFFSKTTILIFYLRIFSPDRNTRIAIWSTIILTTCVSWFIVPVYAALCTPSPGTPWDFLHVPKNCRDSTILGVIQGPLNVVVDLLILILPIPVLYKLQMNRQKVYQLLIVFAVASL